ncbi:endonuclease NucS [Halomarina litorea]|uniref:endonuclease NucS n=1 Tax=Halomarina litorea TaxID=2961595 RepID=UPI0020C53CBA|nr:endonuclease NucS [Halomarina sp. BCD28]
MSTPITTETAPTLEVAYAVLTDGLDADAMLTVVGRCTVDYSGRTESTLGAGDRLVVLKPDGTLLVHQSTNRDPVNWQPPGCRHTVDLEESDAADDAILLVQSERSTPSETVRIEFETIYQVSALSLTDEQDLDLVGSEEDLRQRILADPDLIESGFQPRATERETSAGAVDLYGIDSDGVPVIVELKRRRVGPDAVGQLARYVEAAESERTDKTVRGILVAPSVTDRAQRMLVERDLEFVSLTPGDGGPNSTTLDTFVDRK